MTNPTITELATRVEEATGSSRELDAEICLAIGWTYQKLKGDQRPYYRKPGVTTFYLRSDPPRYTASLDAAMQLLPDKAWDHMIVYRPDHQDLCWSVHLLPNANLGSPQFAGSGQSHALALTAACLRAISQKGDE